MGCHSRGGHGVGSSPRVRGKRFHGLVHERQGRLIPARAGKTAGGRCTRACGGAHPRACGENMSASFAFAASLGSSPRVRGKRSKPDGLPGPLRLIPARAGKTSPSASPMTAARAHPRACGENSIEETTGALAAGSSPRVRGKPPVRIGELLADRLIPARAGKTGIDWHGAEVHWAHPRACGENTGAGIRDFGLTGSSPRVRGKRWGRGFRGVGAWLIPARAGKTPIPAPAHRAPPAHPRACGENVEGCRAAPWPVGSSPRVRGKHRPQEAVRLAQRLIPARAGKTGSPALPGARPRAHPRACGENGVVCGVERAGGGSSPRVRGKLKVFPTQVGMILAHPRACGENRPWTKSAERARGSSPRVRGKREPAREVPQGVRLIPARAGKTSAASSTPCATGAHPRACGENGTRAAM